MSRVCCANGTSGLFLDVCKYECIGSETHAQETRERKSGDVIWPNQGEDAPVLTNSWLRGLPNAGDRTDVALHGVAGQAVIVFIERISLTLRASVSGEKGFAR
jgi:hypothetical protein